MTDEITKLKWQVKVADGRAEMRQQAHELSAEDCRLLYKIAAKYAPREVMQEVREQLHGLGTEWDKLDSVYLRLKQDRADLIRVLKPFAEFWSDNEDECLPNDPAWGDIDDGPYIDAYLLLKRMKEIE